MNVGVNIEDVKAKLQDLRQDLNSASQKDSLHRTLELANHLFQVLSCSNTMEKLAQDGVYNKQTLEILAERVAYRAFNESGWPPFTQILSILYNLIFSHRGTSDTCQLIQTLDKTRLDALMARLESAAHEAVILHVSEGSPHWLMGFFGWQRYGGNKEDLIANRISCIRKALSDATMTPQLSTTERQTFCDRLKKIEELIGSSQKPESMLSVSLDDKMIEIRKTISQAKQGDKYNEQQLERLLNAQQALAEFVCHHAQEAVQKLMRHGCAGGECSDNPLVRLSAELAREIHCCLPRTHYCEDTHQYSPPEYS